MDPMLFNVIWEDLMDENEENKDVIAKNKEQEVLEKTGRIKTIKKTLKHKAW